MDGLVSYARVVPAPLVFPERNSSLKNTFDRILKWAGIAQVDDLGEKLTAHSFRHTFGTMLAEQGANAFVIQNVLRHADPKMTARYVERATTNTMIDISDLLKVGANG